MYSDDYKSFFSSKKKVVLFKVHSFSQGMNDYFLSKESAEEFVNFQKDHDINSEIFEEDVYT